MMHPLPLVTTVGRFANTLGQSLQFRCHMRYRNFIQQCTIAGVESLPIVLLTSAFTGAVLALQGFYAFSSGAFASQELGPLVGLSLVRELGPVLAGLMVAGRVGAAMAAEIGTLRTHEQLDALYAMAIRPAGHVLLPRWLATTCMMPLLFVAAVLAGIVGSLVVSTTVLKLNGAFFLTTLLDRWV